MKTYYVTKYALTTGILKVQGELFQGKYVSARRPNGNLFMALGTDAFESLEAAQERARQMRNVKIASLRKQLKKLEAGHSEGGYVSEFPVKDWNAGEGGELVEPTK